MDFVMDNLLENVKVARWEIEKVASTVVLRDLGTVESRVDLSVSEMVRLKVGPMVFSWVAMKACGGAVEWVVT